MPQLSVEIAGVASTSPLAQSIATRLDGLADLNFDEAPLTAPFYWHWSVTNTPLQWFSAVPVQRSAHAPAPGSSLVIDLHGRKGQVGARIWRIVDKHGAGLLSPATALTRCCSEAYTASLFLVESLDGGATWYQLCDAHVSAAAGHRTLLERLGKAAVELLAAGIRRDAGARRPWAPAKRSPARMLQMKLANSSACWWNRLTDETWAIAVVDQPPERLLASQQVVAKQWIRPPVADSFIADPFSWDGRPNTILCELFSFGTRRGTLEALEIQDGRITRTQPVTPDLQCHFSYPFNWTENGRTYCMPEMGESRRQVLYELVPDGPLRPVCVLAEDVPMADPTLFRLDGLYWLAYTNSDIGLFDNLCLRFAERLEGPWREHPLNPVKIDIRSARPGGTPFRVGERLFRPAQNCARSYGVALAVNRVEVCTPDRYEEQTVSVLSPDPHGPFPDGLHTLSIQNGIVLIDGKRLALSSVPRKLRAKMSQLLRRPSSMPTGVH